MIVITRIVRNDKKEIAFVEPYCIFNGDMNEANEACIKLSLNDVNLIEYFAKDVDIYNVGDFLL